MDEIQYLKQRLHDIAEQRIAMGAGAHRMRGAARPRKIVHHKRGGVQAGYGVGTFANVGGYGTKEGARKNPYLKYIKRHHTKFGYADEPHRKKAPRKRAPRKRAPAKRAPARRAPAKRATHKKAASHNPWIQWVKATYDANPGSSYCEIMCDPETRKAYNAYHRR